MIKIIKKRRWIRWKNDEDVSNNLFAYDDNVNCNFNGWSIYITRDNDGGDDNESISKRIHYCDNDGVDQEENIWLTADGKNKNFSRRW